MPAPITIPFGPYEPDAAHLNSGVVTTATAVLPAPVGYTYMPYASSISSVTATAPLTGGVVIQTSSAGAYSLYYGTTNIIRRIDSSALNTATTIATSTQPTAPATWRFAKFGTKLIAAHAAVAPLYEDWTSAPAGMSTLGGSPPQASGVFTVGDFVFLTGLNSNKRKLQWSAINDAEGWTVGTGLSDEQEFPDGGDIFGIYGDKNGFVIQQNAIRSFQFLPGDTATIFQFSKVMDVPGCAGPNAWTTAGQTVYYYSEEGFCSIGPGGFKRIGSHRVDATFKALHTTIANIAYVRAVADPYGPRIFFSHDVNADGISAGALIYDWMLDRWSEAGNQFGFWFNHLDATGGGAQIGNSSSALFSLSGANTGSTITTAVAELIPGQRALVKELRPVVSGVISSAATAATEVISGGGTTTSSSSTQNTNGRFSVLASGGYHAFTVAASSADTSKYLKGIQVWASPAGEA